MHSGAFSSKFVQLINFHFNTKKRRKADNMSPMKNPKRPFYDFYIKFMMYLEHSSWKFPIPRLREGGKQGGKLSHWLYKPKFLPFIPSRLRGRGGRASDFQSVGRRFDPWWRVKFFFLSFFLLFDNFRKFCHFSLSKYHYCYHHFMETFQNKYFTSITTIL